MRILLIYPNAEGYGRVPLALSILSACLKGKGHEIRLFDLTFTMSKNIDNEMREKTGQVKKVETSKYWGEVKDVDIVKSISKEIEAFDPGLIGITIIQNNYWASLKLLRVIKNKSRAHVVAGGVFATIAREDLLRKGLVDSVIMGEGEEAMVELTEMIESRKNIYSIKNLAYIKNDKVRTNPVRGYIDIDKLPFQDLSLFDERHFLKAFDGKIFRTGYFELTRGCPFSCTYCANYYFNKKLYSKEKKCVRFKDPLCSIEEIETLNNRYKFELIFFADENLLVLPYEKLKKFSKLWIKRIKLPFFITSRVEVTTEDKVSLLKDMGCATISFGIECGNENFRRKVLNRMTTNEQIINAFNLCGKYKIRTTANNMFGFPYETEKLIFDTIKLNIAAKPDSYALSIFAPYIGTKLHSVCVKEGYLRDGVPQRISMVDRSILNMPQISRKRIQELYFDFVKYVSGQISLPSSLS